MREFQITTENSAEKLVILLKFVIDFKGGYIAFSY